MPVTLALSTCWNSHRHSDGAAMLREIAALGFTHIELSHGTRVALVPGIRQALREQVVAVQSVHAFCPLPTGINHSAPNLFEPSAADESERTMWKRYARQTLEFSADVGAKAVVFHLGSAKRRWWDPVEKLEDMAESVGPAAAGADPRFVAKRNRVLEGLRKRSVEPWQRTVEALHSIAERASELGVRGGLENREGIPELPLDEQWATLWEKHSLPENFGYWHDWGHARIKAQLGFLDEKTHLTAMTPRLLGHHLHDVDAEGNDHVAVGAGSVDFENLSSCWREGQLFTLELSRRCSAEDVASSADRIRSLMARRGLD